MKTIEIENVGAIQQLSIPLSPGVTVLSGRNGAGKSTALRAIGALATGEAPELEVRDGVDEDVRGRISGLGALFTVGRRRAEATASPSGKNRGTGELEVRTLRGLNPLELVNPGVSDPERADARRIALLCDLAQVAGGIGVFCDALGNNVKTLASRKTLDATSVPDIAAGLRRDIQTAAREVEERVTRLDGEIAAHLSASGGVDGAEPAVQANHAAEVAAAIRELDALRAKGEQARKLGDQAAKSREELERARASYSGPTIDQARAAIAETQATVDRVTNEIQRLQATLADERAALSGLRIQLQAAEAHESNLKRWSDSIAAGETAVSVDAGDLERAEQRVAVAQAAQSEDAVIAEKRKRRREADALTAKRDKASLEAAALRELATKCEAVVTDIVNKAGLGLRVRNGRLVHDTARGETLVSDLSFGEGVRLAVEIAAKSFGREEALLVVPQEAFEGLDPKNQRELDAIARECGVAIITARATSGELQAVPYGCSPAIPEVA